MQGLVVCWLAALRVRVTNLDINRSRRRVGIPVSFEQEAPQTRGTGEKGNLLVVVPR